MRSCLGPELGQQRHVFHSLRTSKLVRQQLDWFLRYALYLFEGSRAPRHRASASGEETSDCASMVASLHSFVVLLAFVLERDCNRYLVCCDELFCARCYVRIFCDYCYQISQVCDSVCHLHHTCAVDADAGWHVRYNQSSHPPEAWGGMSREQDQFCTRSGHVLQLFRAVLQIVCG